MPKDYICPICSQYMDFIVVSHKTKPFVDGNIYPQMCFGCYHTPKEYILNYAPDGSIGNIEGPFYVHRILNTAQELYENGSTFSLKEAQTCVNAVKKNCLLKGKNKLDKMRLRKPEPTYHLNEDYNRQQDELWAKRRKNK